MPAVWCPYIFVAISIYRFAIYWWAKIFSHHALSSGAQFWSSGRQVRIECATCVKQLTGPDTENRNENSNRCYYNQPLLPVLPRNMRQLIQRALFFRCFSFFYFPICFCKLVYFSITERAIMARFEYEAVQQQHSKSRMGPMRQLDFKRRIFDFTLKKCVRFSYRLPTE